jgi:hypothetical protein
VAAVDDVEPGDADVGDGAGCSECCEAAVESMIADLSRVSPSGPLAVVGVEVVRG